MSGRPWNRTRITEKLGIEYPIIQGPLGGFPTQKLTALVSNFGGLGSFGGLNLGSSQLRDAIQEIRGMTSRPFSVNLWVSTEDQAAFTTDEAAFNRSLTDVLPFIQEVGGQTPGF